MKLNISQRLLCAASFIRNCETTADIGCDHAYLPIYLIQNKIASRVIACDINDGPCERARENISRAGLSDKITVLKTDGLKGIDAFAPDNIVICGMGGELILRIICESEYTRIKRPLLILQPMTKVKNLRAGLLERGYRIIAEEFVRDDRIYQVICAQYDAIPRKRSDALLLAGESFPSQNSQLRYEYIGECIKKLETIIKQKNSFGLSTEKEQRIISELEEL